MTNEQYVDIFIVGGGINGVGIATDAAGRGLNVALCERNDLASATSSASSKLIHGGLRYLEHREFRMVREALAERELLLNKAPHLIKPLRFMLPHRPHLRPAWIIRTGLFLYDHLSRRNELPGSKLLRLDPEDANNPLANSISKAFTYSDCQADDSRLVVANALQAEAKGAQILVQTECIQAERKDGMWQLTLKNTVTGATSGIQAKALVNATGPWAQTFIETALHTDSPRKLKLVKGSHFVVPSMYAGDQAYILQNSDQRIVFVIPYDKDFTLIGTTDQLFVGDPREANMDEAEERYLLDVVNEHFKKTTQSEDILWRYSGVRALCDDESESPAAMTRDYTLELETDAEQQTPLLSVFGGKLTTYRKLAAAAMAQLESFFPDCGSSDTASSTLPGGDLGGRNYEQWQREMATQYSWLPENLMERLCLAYGSRVEQLLAGCGAVEDLGQHFGGGLYQQEVAFLLDTEWARSADDILWRRSKLGLRLKPEEVETLSAFIAARLD